MEKLSSCLQSANASQRKQAVAGCSADWEKRIDWNSGFGSFKKTSKVRCKENMRKLLYIHEMHQGHSQSDCMIWTSVSVIYCPQMANRFGRAIPKNHDLHTTAWSFSR